MSRELVWKEDLQCLILCLCRTRSSDTEASHGHSTTARLRHQIFRLNQGEQADLDFGLGEILSPEDLALILTEEGATWKTIIYTPLLTTWAFLSQMLSPDRSCRAAVKRIAAWLSSQGKKLANDKDDPYIKARQRLPETVPLRLMNTLVGAVMSGLRLPGDGVIGR